MKPSFPFQPVFTVPNYHQQLSAKRFVQVYTYDFRDVTMAEGSRASVGLTARGTVHHMNGVRHLPPHDHEHHEMAIVLAGTATHRTAYDARPVGRGMVLTASPSDTHSFEHIDGLYMVNCTYLAEYLFYDVREVLSVPGLAPLFCRDCVYGASCTTELPQWSATEDMIEACLYELGDIAKEREREEPSAVFVRRTLEKLMLLLCRAFQESGQELPVPSSRDVQAVLEQIEDVISANEPFDAACLAQRMGLSRDRLARRFRNAMGRTPTDYYQHRRVQQACCLLLDKNRTVTEVAHELGYYDTPHFSRLFKRYRGITPKAYRERHVEV